MQPVHLGQDIENFLGNTIGKISLAAVLGEVSKRQYCNGVLRCDKLALVAGSLNVNMAEAEERRQDSLHVNRHILDPVKPEGGAVAVEESDLLNIEGRGANARIEVNFAEGSKWLVLQYANLQAL